MSKEELAGDLRCCVCDKKVAKEAQMLLMPLRKSWVAIHELCFDRSMARFRDFHPDI